VIDPTDPINLPRHHIDERDLETIIRIHEFGHAAVDSGITRNPRWDAMASHRDDGAILDDAAAFVASRNTLFSSIPDDTHELLAQAVAWSCIREFVPHLGATFAPYSGISLRNTASARPISTSFHLARCALASGAAQRISGRLVACNHQPSARGPAPAGAAA
jgi:hypothetical protein